MADFWVITAGWIGSAFILVNYIALTKKWIPGGGNIYQVLVLMTSLVFGYMNWMLKQYPVVGINVLFGCLTASVLLRRFALRSRDQVSQGDIRRRRRTGKDEEDILGTRCRCGSPCCKDRVDRLDEV